MTATPLTDRYRQMDVTAMTPVGLIVALYARAILALKQARVAIDQQAIEVREQRLLHATDILHELAASLDHDQGGEVAHQLAALYAWMIRECFEVHRHPDARRLDPVIRSLTELHETWAEVARQAPPSPTWRKAG